MMRLLFCPLSTLLLVFGSGNSAYAFTSSSICTESALSSIIANHDDYDVLTRTQISRIQYEKLTKRIHTTSTSSLSLTSASTVASTPLQLRMSSSHDENLPPPCPIRIAIMGGGNFGLALATVVARQHIPTTLLIRDEKTANIINTTHGHPRYMKDITLSENIVATSDPVIALSDATHIIHAVPCQYSRSFLNKVKDYVPPSVPVLSASKGIETSSLCFMHDILKDCLGEDRSYAFISGPSFAREVCEGLTTAVVIASEDLMLAEDLADIMSSENFRAFTSKDVIGVQIGGAVKNVIALAAGMCEGLGLGTNAMSGLVTRGCAEMRRFGLTMGARPSTIAGLSGSLEEFHDLDSLKHDVNFWFYVCQFNIIYRSWRYIRYVLWTIITQSKVWLSIR
jgi:glycerol-3-phosphate dehydrogenase (NAD+)